MFAFDLPHLDAFYLIIINVVIGIVAFCVNIYAAKYGASESRCRFIIISILSIYMVVLFGLAFTNEVSDETAAFFISACFGIQWIVMGIWPAISEARLFQETKRRTEDALRKGAEYE